MPPAGVTCTLLSLLRDPQQGGALRRTLKLSGKGRRGARWGPAGVPVSPGCCHRGPVLPGAHRPGTGVPARFRWTLGPTGLSPCLALGCKAGTTRLRPEQLSGKLAIVAPGSWVTGQAQGPVAARPHAVSMLVTRCMGHAPSDP